MQKAKISNKIPLEIFVDGASRGNPGKAGAGIYIRQQDQDVIRTGFFLGKKTNNQAEYLALALALFVVQELSDLCELEQIIITTDSELLVKQINGAYAVKNPVLKQLSNLVHTFLQDTNYKIRHVLREKNKIADGLANQGIDKKTELPSDFLCLLKQNSIDF